MNPWQWPAETSKERSIATVLNKPLFLKDIVVDQKDETPLRDYFAIADHIWVPLQAKFVKDHHVVATPEEITDFNNALDSANDQSRRARTKQRQSKALPNG